MMMSMYSLIMTNAKTVQDIDQEFSPTKNQPSKCELAASNYCDAGSTNSFLLNKKITNPVSHLTQQGNQDNKDIACTT